MPELEIFSDLGDFLNSVSPLLEVKEAEYALILGLAQAFQTNPPRSELFMGRVGNMAAFFSGMALILSEGRPDEVIELVDHLAAKKWRCPGVVGPIETSKAFRDGWLATTGCAEDTVYYQLIYELRKVDPPAGPGGFMRLATFHDEPQLFQWTKEFQDEAWSRQRQDMRTADEVLATNLALKIGEQRQFVWEDEGRLVSMAAYGRPTRRSITIAPVYTPAGERRKGYATALTAAVSQKALDSGREIVTLYTDAENPTSNAIYTKIGFRPVADSRNYWFSY